MLKAHIAICVSLLILISIILPRSVNGQSGIEPQPTSEPQNLPILPQEVVPAENTLQVDPSSPIGDYIYAVSSSTLYFINPTNIGASTTVGATGYSSLTDIAQSNNDLFGITFGQLLHINPANGLASLVGNVGYSVNALVAAADGTLYAATTDGKFIRINKSTGAGTFIGNMGKISSGDMAFLNGHLYITIEATPDLLAEINIITGVATTIGSTSYNNVYAMAELNGILYGGTSSGILLRFNPATGAATPIGSSAVSYMGFASITIPPTNDDFDYAQVLTEPSANGLANQVLDTDTTDATVANDDPDMGCGDGLNSNTLWYRLTPTYFGSLTLRTYSQLDPGANSSYDTVLAVYTGGRGSLQLLNCNDDAYGTTLSELTIDVVPGRTYYIEAAAFGSQPSGGVLSLFYNYQISPKKWTLMFYSAGDNDLGMNTALSRQYLDLIQTENNLHTNILTMLDGVNSETQINVISPFGNQVIPQGELNMGDPQTLQDFIAWSRDNYPANNYALIISDHGHGLKGLAQDFHAPGDLDNNDIITVRELDQVLSSFPKLDILFLNACHMATIDVVFQLLGLTDYLIASEGYAILPSNMGWFINGHSGIPHIDSQTTAEGLATAIARSYVARHAIPGWPGTISVLDMGWAELSVMLTDQLGDALIANMSSIKTTLDGIRQDVQHYDQNGDWINNEADPLVDLYHLTLLIQNRISQVSNHAYMLSTVLDSMVIYEQHWSGGSQDTTGGNILHYPDSHGITIFFPSPQNKYCDYEVNLLDFAHGADWQCGSSWRSPTVNSGWGGMLVEFTQAVNPNAGEEYMNWALVQALPAWNNIWLPLVTR